MEIQEFIRKAPSDLKGVINSHCSYLMDVFYNGDFTRIWGQFKLSSTAQFPDNIDAWNRDHWNASVDVLDELAEAEFEKTNDL